MIADAWGAFLDLLPGEWGIFKEWFVWRFLLEGLWVSARIAGFSIVFSLIVGIAMTVGRLAPVRPVRWFCLTYVEVLRATPLLLLFFFVFFGGGRIDAGWLLHVPGGGAIVDDRGQIQRIPAAIIALTLYNSAVVAEIVRAGILSIPKGVLEASRALGLGYLGSMRYVAVPMALRRMAPGLVGQLITLFKDTSLASIISVLELTRRGFLVFDNTQYSLVYGHGNGITIEVLIVVGLFYFVPCYALSLLAQWLARSPERRGSRATTTAILEPAVAIQEPAD
jgi:His/Glu/Gln/Arg/opine family amino acid ABC transporter permease subunit